MDKPSPNFAWLICELGGVAKLRERIFDECGFEPPPFDTVYAWVRRNSLPGRWAVVVIALAMKAGVLGDIWSLLGTGGEDLDDEA